MCSILFLIFNSRTPLRGATLAQSKGSVARAASTHAPARGVTESTNRIGVAGGRFNSRTRGATMYSNYSDDVSFSSRLFFSAHCSICFCLIAFVSADMEIRFPEATSADSG